MYIDIVPESQPMLHAGPLGVPAFSGGGLACRCRLAPARMRCKAYPTVLTVIANLEAWLCCQCPCIQ